MLWASIMVKMSLRYFAKYDIIKIKILTSTHEPFGEPGQSNTKENHMADGFKIVFPLLFVNRRKYIAAEPLALISAQFPVRIQYEEASLPQHLNNSQVLKIPTGT